MVSDMEMNIEVVSVTVLIVGGIASYVRLKVIQGNEKDRLDALVKKQAKDHATLESKQSADHDSMISAHTTKDKELWDEMKAFRETLFGIGQSLGRVEGKLDFLNKGVDHGS